jgi:Rrf2 family nitric oxide-sensitive transcriptional repressor
MRLSGFTDYSLRVLIYLAATPGRQVTIREIAGSFGISAHHLTKVVWFLGQRGWLSTVRGRGGGIALGRPAAEIGVGAVVRATEAQTRPGDCIGQQPDACRIARVCALRGVLHDALEAFYAALDRSTLADLVRNAPALADVLFVRPPPAALQAGCT